MQLTLKNKFLLPSLFLIIFGMGTSGTISYYKAKNAISNALNSQIQQQAEETIGLMDNWLSDQKRDIVYWSNRKDFVGLLEGTSSTETAINDLKDIKANYPYYISVVLADTSGIIVADPNQKDMTRKDDISSRAYFQKAISGNTYISEVLLDRKNKCSDYCSFYSRQNSWKK